MSTIYIAGKISGLSNYRELFEEAELYLLTKGYKVMNPAVLGEGFTYETYMPICLAMLQACDEIYMLENWSVSQGATIERNLAIQLGIKQIYQRSE